MFHRRPLERERENANERKIAKRASDKKVSLQVKQKTANEGVEMGANGTFYKSLFPSHFSKVKISKGKICYVKTYTHILYTDYRKIGYIY